MHKLLLLVVILSFISFNQSDIQITQKEDSFGVDYIMGKFDPSNHKDFMVIPIQYSDQKNRYLRKDVFEAFKRMADDSKKSGHTIIIKSSTRNFDNQKKIWENKWTGKILLEDNTKASSIKNEKERALKILLYSSMPGTSRHHWGTDIDINNFTNAYFEKGEGLKLYKWLQDNAYKYGFCQVYSKKDNQRPNGYNEEKWHWSYMPIASKILEEARTVLTNDKIKGFKGSNVAAEIDIVNKYVFGINPNCK